jgi:hypothetical protein
VKDAADLTFHLSLFPSPPSDEHSSLPTHYEIRNKKRHPDDPMWRAGNGANGQKNRPNRKPGTLAVCVPTSCGLPPEKQWKLHNLRA